MRSRSLLEFASLKAARAALLVSVAVMALGAVALPASAADPVAAGEPVGAVKKLKKRQIKVDAKGVPIKVIPGVEVIEEGKAADLEAPGNFTVKRLPTKADLADDDAAANDQPKVVIQELQVPKGEVADDNANAADDEIQVVERPQAPADDLPADDVDAIDPLEGAAEPVRPARPSRPQTVFEPDLPADDDTGAGDAGDTGTAFLDPDPTVEEGSAADSDDAAVDDQVADDDAEAVRPASPHGGVDLSKIKGLAPGDKIVIKKRGGKTYVTIIKAAKKKVAVPYYPRKTVYKKFRHQEVYPKVLPKRVYGKYRVKKVIPGYGYGSSKSYGSGGY